MTRTVQNYATTIRIDILDALRQEADKTGVPISRMINDEMMKMLKKRGYTFEKINTTKIRRESQLKC